MVSGFYTFTDKLREILENNNHVNTVTYGSIFDIPTDKMTIYPLSHFIVNSVNIEDSHYIFNVSLICMDILDVDKDLPQDAFVGNDNSHDAWNTQLMVITALVQELKKGDMRGQGFELSGTPTLEAFKDNFTFGVAGWTATFDVLVKTDLTVCG